MLQCLIGPRAGTAPRGFLVLEGSSNAFNAMRVAFIYQVFHGYVQNSLLKLPGKLEIVGQFAFI